MPPKPSFLTTLSPGLALAEANALKRQIEEEGLDEDLEAEVRALLQQASPAGRVAAQAELEGAVPTRLLG